MNVRDILRDDDAVSPVIGVILMVAITVILAAVIATFVLGLGEQVSSTAPTASFSTEFSGSGSDSDDGLLTVTHDGGDTIRASEIYVRGDPGDSSHGGLTGNNYNDPWSDFVTGLASNVDAATTDADIDGTNSGEISGESAVTAGDYIELPVHSEGELRIVYEAQEGDTTATLATFEGPDA